MNIVCVKCGTGVMYGLASLTDQTVVVCSGCGTGLRVALQAFEVPVVPSKPPTESSSRRARILVAVEGEATREMIRELLSGAGFEVVEAVSGRDVIAQVNQQQPSLVLVDAGLTDMMGHLVCETIRSLPAGGPIKIILVAAIHNKTRYRREPGNLFGADDFIERHQIEGDLLGKVGTLCQTAPHERDLSAPLRASFGDVEVALSCEGERVPAAVPSVGNTATNLPDLGPQPVAAMAASADPGSAVPAVEPPSRSVVTEEVSVGSVAGAAVPAGRVVPSPVPPAAPERSNATIATVPQPVAASAANTVASPGPASQSTVPGQEAALRLARIIISDIALYNTKKVNESVLQGTFFDVLRHEIGEGRRLYEERLPPDLPRAVDLFQQTLDQFVATRKQLLQRNNQAAA